MSEGGILMNICPFCKHKDICEYGNSVWSSCEHVKRISERLLSFSYAVDSSRVFRGDGVKSSDFLVGGDNDEK